MKSKHVIALTLIAFACAQAHAGGCVKGALVGGAAGHVLGHHAIAGAVGGCLVGRHLDKKKKQEWVLECWHEVQGHECYFGPNGQITLDPAVPALAKLSGQKPWAESEQFQPLLDQIVARLKAEIASGRNPKGCTQFAATITTVAKQIKAPEQKQQWLEQLSKAMTGHEEYTPKGAKPLRDPSADVIRNLLNPPAMEATKK